jgi:hypothetical protein
MPLAYIKSFPYLPVVSQFHFFSDLPSPLPVSIPACWFSHGPWLTFSRSLSCQFSVNSTSFLLCHLPYLSVSLPVGSAMPLAYIESFPYLPVVSQFHFFSDLPSPLPVSIPACWFSHGPWLTFSHSPNCKFSVNSTFQLCHLPDLSVFVPGSSAMLLARQFSGISMPNCLAIFRICQISCVPCLLV